MNEIVQVVYPETYRRYNVRDLRVVYHDIVEEDGIERTVKCLEFTVVGKFREWPNWSRYDDFARVNPDLDLPE